MKFFGRTKTKKVIGNRKMASTLLIIDPQKDFHPGGTLAIDKADEDSERIASLIRNSTEKDGRGSTIERIFVTLDTHHKLHIGHPCFWVNVDGNHPEPFTLISSADVESGLWIPRGNLHIPDGMVDKDIFDGGFNIDGSFDLKKHCVQYTKSVEKSGHFKHCIWPEHCLLGSPGHNVVDVIRIALDDWVASTGRSVVWVCKGQNLLSENYSALSAEVPVSRATEFDNSLYQSLQLSNRLLICGQALSHCVNYTARDIVKKWPPAEMSKICILTNCASNVTGFESAGDNFLKDMKKSGVRLCLDSNAFD